MQFLERALDGQNRFWKYIVMIFAVFIGGQLIGSIPLAITMIAAVVKTGGMPPTMSNGLPDLSVLNLPSSVTLALMLIVFAAMLVVFALLVWPMHRRTLTETINGRKRIRWNRIYLGMLVWGAVSLVSMAASYLISPLDFEWQFRPWQFLSLLAVVIVLLPFQTTCEEVLFRGYLSQGIGAWTRNRWWVLLIPSVLFALLHSANPEIKAFGFWAMMPQYLLMGLFFGLISVLDDGIELALGAHFIHNALTALFTTHAASALQTDALFKITIEEVTATDTLLFAAYIALAILIFGRICKWDFRTLNRKIAPNLPPFPETPADIAETGQG